MIEGISAGAANTFHSGNSLRGTSGGSSKVKLDLDSAPESKVRIQAPASAGKEKGLVLDIKA